MSSSGQLTRANRSLSCCVEHSGSQKGGQTAASMSCLKNFLKKDKRFQLGSQNVKKSLGREFLKQELSHDSIAHLNCALPITKTISVIR